MGTWEGVTSQGLSILEREMFCEHKPTHINMERKIVGLLLCEVGRLHVHRESAREYRVRQNACHMVKAEERTIRALISLREKQMHLLGLLNLVRRF